MSCSCNFAPRPFKLMVDGKEKNIWRLDQIVFSTISSFPKSEQVVAEQLWQELRLMNEVSVDEAATFRNALLPIYLESKKSCESDQENEFITVK